MKSVIFLFFIALLASVYAEEDHVVVGTTDNFDDLVKDGFVLVEFYAPWCGHCKSLEPEYKKAAAQLKESGSEVVLVKVDATVESDLGSRFDVKGFPTLKFFRGGNAIDYDGPRDAAGIVAWVTKKSGPASTVLADEEAVTAFVEKNRPCVVGVFAEGSADLDVFMAVAQVEDDFVFGNVAGEATTITLYTLDEGDKVYDGEIEKVALKEWIKTEGYPALQELNQNVWTRSSAAQISIFTMFIDVADAEVFALADKVAKAYKGKITATFMDAATQGALAERWGASGKVFPTAVMISYERNEPALYTWDEENEPEYSFEALSSFVEKALEGTYKSYQKSEPIPETNDEDVKVIVGKTFEDFVGDSTKDVFVEFYAPWCGHCKKLAPIFDQLGAKFADVESVVIAKIDATANNVPDYLGIKGFPTLYLFPAGEGSEPVLFEGARELEDMAAFIKQNAGTDFTIPEGGHEEL